MTPAPSAAPLPPLPEYVEEAIREYALQIRGAHMGLGSAEEEATALAALEAAIRRHAEEAARGAGEHEPMLRTWLEVLKSDGPISTVNWQMVAGWALDALAPDPRPAGCVCPVERVVKVLRSCTKHGERKP